MKNRLAIVLAAGKGTRMRSELPKVLFPINGRPMIHYVLDALKEADIEKILVVVGYRADLLQQELGMRHNLEFVEQKEQKGTGHATMVCREQLAEHQGAVVVVTGDSPLLQSSSVLTLLETFYQEKAGCVLGTLHRDNPQGLGRIVRDETGRFAGIVEEKDATEAERSLTEVNMSTYVFDCEQLLAALDQLSDDNLQQEYYLTDCPRLIQEAGQQVLALPTLKPCEALSINTLDDLALVESRMQDLGY
ncbi:MAG: NTP transferase domain-containing protein [Planctomycetota bacterium]|nr:NTP transferase domain-containing protein [Planctomycetota bacterium]